MSCQANTASPTEPASFSRPKVAISHSSRTQKCCIQSQATTCSPCTNGALGWRRLRWRRWCCGRAYRNRGRSDRGLGGRRRGRRSVGGQRLGAGRERRCHRRAWRSVAGCAGRGVFVGWGSAPTPLASRKSTPALEPNSTRATQRHLRLVSMRFLFIGLDSITCCAFIQRRNEIGTTTIAAHHTLAGPSRRRRPIPCLAASRCSSVPEKGDSTKPNCAIMSNAGDIRG